MPSMHPIHKAEGLTSAALAGHLLFALFLWPAIQLFREGVALLPFEILLFVACQGLRHRSPLGWRSAVGAEACLFLGLVVTAGVLAQHRAYLVSIASSDFPILALLGFFLALALLSAATLLFLLRHETRARYGVSQSELR